MTQEEYGGLKEKLDQERPEKEGGTAWLLCGLERYRWPALLAFVLCWGGATNAIFLAVLGGVTGGFAAVIGALIPTSGGGGMLGFVLGNVLEGAPEWLRQSLAAGGFFVGAATGALTGLLFGLVGPAVTAGASAGISYVTGHILVGAALALVALFVMLLAEWKILEIAFGARRPSARENERLKPILDDLKWRMNIEKMPSVYVLEKPDFGAYSHPKSISIPRTELNRLEDDEVAALLAHELSHYKSADSIGITIVWAAAWPLILLFNVLMFFSRADGSRVLAIIAALAWLVAWPIWISVRGILVPAIGYYSRQYEYEADESAVEAGYGEALHRALETIQDIEPGRTGWERSIAATHPPTELRLEAITERMERASAEGSKAGR